MGRYVTRAVVGAAMLFTLVRPAPAQDTGDPYAACRRQLAANPDDYESAFCFYQVTLDGQRWDEGARVFDELIGAQPANAWLPLAYGHVYRSRDPDRAERLYRRAADAFQRWGGAEGELLARSNLRDLLWPLGRTADAAREVDRVVEIGNASADPLLKARAWSLQAVHVQSSGGDLGFASRLLKQAERAIFPDGPYRLKRTTLNSLGLAASRMGRLDEAIEIFERLDRLAAAEGDEQTEAIARYNVFNTTAMQENALPSPGSRARLLPLVQRALDAGQAARHPIVMMRSHAALAELLARVPESRPAALHHVQQCLTLAAAARQPYDEAVCSWIEAALVHDHDLQRARAAEVRAIEATDRANNPRTTAFSAARQMRFSWIAKPRTDAVRDSLAAIDAVETLRALQDEADSSADLFSTWTLDYYWLSGRLLQAGADGDLELAFSITERMRARSLLDAIARSRVPPDPEHPAVKEHRAALQRIAALQRTLMNPTLADSRRQSGLRELERLERRAQEATRQISLAFPRRPRAPEAFATIEAVQSGLAADEALLSFQVGLWDTYEGDFGGGAWLIAVTRSADNVYRLPDRVALSTAIPVFTGLLEGGGGREGAAAVRLYRDLLADAMAELPAAVRRLIIVADGALHRLPFEALRAAGDAPPLGARYQIAVAPSATLWLQWRAEGSRRFTARVLTLADPALEGGGSAAAAVRNAPLLQGLRLGRLPHARDESRAIQRHVGNVDTLLGAQASEKSLKLRDLRKYDIVHVAAHAVADEVYPERSAVVLSPGDGHEDGLLQVREIASLDLSGRIVVLSACYTAGGAVLSGEGVLSLARAFFAAGAHAVIGSRWPLRDADASELFDVFYQHLGRGASLSEALNAAQNAARAAGRPASSWAALVLLGNGDLRPFAGVSTPAGRSSGPLVLVVLIASLAGVFLVRRRARVRPRTFVT